MNIKKIIKEEISDFDWVNKVKPTIRPSDLVGYSITYLGPESWVITDYGEDEGSPYLTVSSPHGVSNIWLSHVIRQVKEGNYTIRDKKGNIIEPQEFRVIKEEAGDFDWAKSTNNPNTVDTTRDYMGVWPDFERMLSELDIPYIEGVVNSDDYEGTAYMRIRTLYFEFDVDIRFDYDEQSIETGTVYWTIEDPNEDSDGRFSGQHSLVSNHWIKPIVDKLREMVEPLVNERKYKPWGHLSGSNNQ